MFFSGIFTQIKCFTWRMSSPYQKGYSTIYGISAEIKKLKAAIETAFLASNDSFNNAFLDGGIDRAIHDIDITLNGKQQRDIFTKRITGWRVTSRVCGKMYYTTTASSLSQAWCNCTLQTLVCMKAELDKKQSSIITKSYNRSHNR